MAETGAQGAVTVQREGAVIQVWLRHAGRLNAITAEMWEQLGKEFTRIASDETVHCVLIRGADGNFSAGADITEFPRLRTGTEALFQFHQRIIAPALRAIRDCPHPTVAAIQGLCIGGGLEIACGCDLRIAARSARFGAPIRELGFPMAPEELQAILAVAGRNVALELLLEGKILTADEAAAKGLLTRVAADADLDGEIVRTVANLVAGPALVARLNKETLRHLAPPAPPWSETELRRFYAAWADSPDHREGVKAFLEKRRPNFGTTN